jgi:multicomponent Na+:H+ antiporter subunit G
MEIVVEALLYVSGIFAVIGSAGLVRFPDFYTRTHAATLLGVGSISLALFALIVSTFWSAYTLKIVVIITFNLFTNPTATHAIADKAYRMGIKPKKLVRNEMET